MSDTVAPVSNAPPPHKLLLLTMVKNESRIIERLLSSVLGKVDAIVVCDTGSTDNTVTLATQFLGKHGVPGKVYSYPFKNFGASRTASFECAQTFVRDMGWDAAATWALLLDGDMLLTESIPRAALAAVSPEVAGISLKQANGSLLYSNMRVLRCSEPWICKGATHEAWTCPPARQTVLFETPVLTDHGDGGCKADKYERDVRLLKEDLAEMPGDARTLFYLGQTYLCMRDWPNAIDYLRQRIAVGGWDEEVYIAEVYLGEALEASGRGAEAVEVWLAAWQRRQHRTEAAIRAISYYRRQPKSQFIAGMFLEKLFERQFGKTFTMGEQVGAPANNQDILFVNRRDVDYHIWEEAAILAYYTGQGRSLWLHMDELDLTTRLNWHDFNALFGQIHWYDWCLKPRSTQRFAIPLEQLPWAAEDQAACWQPFNPSLRAKPDGSGFQLNLRYANYYTKEAKHYEYRGFHGQVLTRNLLCDISGSSHPDWNAPASMREIKIRPEFKQREEHYIRGVEDCRLVSGSEQLEFMGTSQSYSENGTNKIFYVYGPNDDGFALTQVPLPPGVSPGETQKNWLPFRRSAGGPLLHIYSFSPFKVCDSATGVPVMSVDTVGGNGAPQGHFTLKEYRGSAGPTAWTSAARPEEAWLCVMHKVYIGGDGRRYYHRFMTLDKALRPSRVSCWVRMTKERVEYWSGLATGDGETYWVTYGVQDSQAYVAELGREQIEQLMFFDISTGAAVPVRERLAAVAAA